MALYKSIIIIIITIIIIILPCIYWLTDVTALCYLYITLHYGFSVHLQHRTADITMSYNSCAI